MSFTILKENDIKGIALTLDDPNHQLPWLFRDNHRLGWLFVHYIIWHDELATELAPLVMGIFERSGHDGVILSAHVSMLINSGSSNIMAERTEGQRVLIYVVDDSDGAVVINGGRYPYAAGSFYTINKDDDYYFIKPKESNFVKTLEIEFV